MHYFFFVTTFCSMVQEYSKPPCQRKQILAVFPPIIAGIVVLLFPIKLPLVVERE